MARALGEHRAVVLQNHGVITVGGSVEEAADWFVSFDRAARVQLLAEAAGTPAYLGDDAARLAHAQFGSPRLARFSLQILFDDIVLVGHSYGGMVVTGVAGRVPEHIRRLVYLDAVRPEPRQAVFDIIPALRPDVRRAARRAPVGLAARRHGDRRHRRRRRARLVRPQVHAHARPDPHRAATGAGEGPVDGAGDLRPRRGGRLLHRDRAEGGRVRGRHRDLARRRALPARAAPAARRRGPAETSTLTTAADGIPVRRRSVRQEVASSVASAVVPVTAAPLVAGSPRLTAASSICETS
ncbi:MAG: alpha/beta fold hydrolase [Pseudonocardiaceae bacterium]|nr:MAG: alpha/beta fold hydrolase [Pseudonocardiaceae bacterium]